LKESEITTKKKQKNNSPLLWWTNDNLIAPVESTGKGSKAQKNYNKDRTSNLSKLRNATIVKPQPLNIKVIQDAPKKTENNQQQKK